MLRVTLNLTDSDLEVGEMGGVTFSTSDSYNWEMVADGQHDSWFSDVNLCYKWVATSTI